MWGGGVGTTDPWPAEKKQSLCTNLDVYRIDWSRKDSVMLKCLWPRWSLGVYRSTCGPHKVVRVFLFVHKNTPTNDKVKGLKEPSFEIPSNFPKFELNPLHSWRPRCPLRYLSAYLLLPNLTCAFYNMVSTNCCGKVKFSSGQCLANRHFDLCLWPRVISTQKLSW